MDKLQLCSSFKSRFHPVTERINVLKKTLLKLRKIVLKEKKLWKLKILNCESSSMFSSINRFEWTSIKVIKVHSNQKACEIAARGNRNEWNQTRKLNWTFHLLDRKKWNFPFPIFHGSLKEKGEEKVTNCVETQKEKHETKAKEEENEKLLPSNWTHEKTCKEKASA